MINSFPFDEDTGIARFLCKSIEATATLITAKLTTVVVTVTVIPASVTVAEMRGTVRTVAVTASVMLLIFSAKQPTKQSQKQPQTDRSAKRRTLLFGC